MIQYILECIAFQLVFLIVYDFFLKRETFFQWNRIYLIGTYILSMVLPWIKIEALKAMVPEKYYAYPEFLWANDDTSMAVVAKETASQISIGQVFLFGGMFFAALLFGFKMVQLNRLRKRGEVHFFEDFTKIIISNSSLAFSFFKSIFIGAKIVENEQKNIVRHELVHIRQRHSWDLLFFELMRIIGWFNPLVYVYQGRVSELHEFIADAQVAKNNKEEQYQLLLSKVFQTQKISFINQFFKGSLIKKRIVMLQKTKSKRVYQLKYLFLIPIVAGMLFYSSCQNEQSVNLDNTIRVADIENLTSEEEKEVFDKLIDLSKNSKDWELYVKDGNASMKFIPSSDGSHISGPKNEQIHAKLAIDSKLVSRDYNSISDFLNSRNVLYDSSEGNGMSKYNQLVMERQRLLKSADKNNPIITNLDQQLEVLKKQVLANNTGTVAFAWTDEAPIFPGCDNETDTRACFQNSMQKHISDNFNYPKEAQEQGIQGRVNVMFTITTDGSIQNIRKRGPDKLLENEAERIIKLLPRMKPGKYDGKVVNVPFSIPISFKLR